MTTINLIPATQKQVDYLRSLIANKEVTETERADWFDRLNRGYFDKVGASNLIDLLLKRPYKKHEPAAKPKANPVVQEMLSTIPKSRYALNVADFTVAGVDHTFTGDLVFIQVKEYMGTLYMRQLLGSFGGFTRKKMTTEQVKLAVGLIKADPYAATKRFGEHYSCCGCCGAELTDERSRELQLGPECRKKFGF